MTEIEIVIPEDTNTIEKYKDDDADNSSSFGELSTLVSPTTMWMTGNMTPVSTFPPKVSIHTGGVDLKTVLSYGGMDYNNNSNEYILFTDDEGSSPATSQIGDNDDQHMEDLLSPISSSSIMGVEQHFLPPSPTEEPQQEQEPQQQQQQEQQQQQQQDVIKDAMFSSPTSEDWSVHNQQRGREVAKQVLQKVRSRNSNKSNIQLDKNVIQCRISTKGMLDTTTEKKFPANTTCTTGATGAATVAKPSNKNRRGIISRCMNRLRRRRRKLLDSLFSQNGSAHATSKSGDKVGGRGIDGESQTVAASPPSEYGLKHRTQSYGSTDSGESYRSLGSGGFADGEGSEGEYDLSIYIEDDDMGHGYSISQIMDRNGGEVDEATEIDKRGEGKDESTQEEDGQCNSVDATPKRSNTTQDIGSMTSSGIHQWLMLQKKIQQHQLRAVATPSSSGSGSSSSPSAVTNFSWDDKKQIHRPSQVVDSILRQFGDNAKAVADAGAEEATTSTSGQQQQEQEQQQKQQKEHLMTPHLLVRRHSDSNGAAANSKVVTPIRLHYPQPEPIATGSGQKVPQQESSRFFHRRQRSESAGNINFQNNNENTNRKTISRARDFAESVDEIRKLGKEGERYVGQKEHEWEQLKTEGGGGGGGRRNYERKTRQLLHQHQHEEWVQQRTTLNGENMGGELFLAPCGNGQSQLFCDRNGRNLKVVGLFTTASK